MGNVFESAWDALIDDRGEAENLKIRSELMISLERYISENNLTQGAAAKLLGVSQPRISDIVKGKIEKFTIDALVNMLAKTGMKTTVTVANSRPANHSISGAGVNP